MPDPTPPPPDPADEKAQKDQEQALEAERLRAEADQLKSLNSNLRAQVDELKALTSRQDEPAKDLQRLHLLQIQPVRDILVISLILGLFWLGYILRSITIPMLLALTLAYLVEPIVDRLVRGKYMTRMQAAASVIMLSVILLTVPLAVGTTFAISQGIDYQQSVRRNITYVQQVIKNPEDEAARKRLSNSGGKAWSWIADIIAGFANPEPETRPAAPTDTEGVQPTQGEPAESTSESASAPPIAPPGNELPKTGPAAPIETEPPLAAEPQRGAATPASKDPEVDDQRSMSERATVFLTSTFENNLQGIGRAAARYLVGNSSNALELGVKTIGTIVYLGFAFFLVLFFFFFFCTGYQRVTNSIANLIPKWKRNRTLELLRQMDLVIAGFVRGRLIIMGILMVCFTLGYWLIGVPAPLIVGPITGILAVVPYLGLVSIPTAMLLMWLQPVGADWQQTWWWIIFAPIGLYFLIQTVEDYVLTPLIQGKATQMDTPSILFAVLAGGILAGFYGVLLAIPAAACIKILLREAFWPRFQAWAEGKVKDFLPISRYDPTETGSSSPEPKPRG